MEVFEMGGEKSDVVDPDGIVDVWASTKRYVILENAFLASLYTYY